MSNLFLILSLTKIKLTFSYFSLNMKNNYFFLAQIAALAFIDGTYASEAESSQIDASYFPVEFTDRDIDIAKEKLAQSHYLLIHQ